MANKKVLKNNELQVKFRKGESITNLITEQNTIFFYFVWTDDVSNTNSCKTYKKNLFIYIRLNCISGEYCKFEIAKLSHSFPKKSLSL